MVAEMADTDQMGDDELSADELSEDEAEMLGLTAEFLDAVFSMDEGELARLRELPDVDWWNVSLTLAYLMRDISSGKPIALRILADTIEQAQASDL